jgi:hypothetical protein
VVKNDGKIKGNLFQVGEKVWLFTSRRRKGISPKLQSYWTGPYVVEQRLSDVTNVIVKTPGRVKQIVHFNRLKPYFSREEDVEPPLVGTPVEPVTSLVDPLKPHPS